MVIQHQTSELKNPGERGGKSLNMGEIKGERRKGRGSEAGTLKKVFGGGCRRFQAIKSIGGNPTSSKPEGYEGLWG